MTYGRRFVVVDTCTLISAVLKPNSLPARALDLVRVQGEIAVSLETLAELGSVLSRNTLDRYSAQTDRTQFLTFYTQAAVLFEVTEQVLDCRDAKDNKFLSLALAAKATVIVSSDADLQVLHPYRGIAILSPSQVLALARR